MNLSNEDYVRLLTFRDGLRRFLSWSEAQAHAAGVTAAQHQLLLAVRGHGSSPSVTDLVDHLMQRHHSVVELVDRAEAAGLVQRVADPSDHRVVRVKLRAKGTRALEQLSAAHIEELSRIVPALTKLWSALPSG
jgi:DNA-binding MarR family transcriptional regulator